MLDAFNRNPDGYEDRDTYVIRYSAEGQGQGARPGINGSWNGETIHSVYGRDRTQSEAHWWAAAGVGSCTIQEHWGVWQDKVERGFTIIVQGSAEAAEVLELLRHATYTPRGFQGVELPRFHWVHVERHGDSGTDVRYIEVNKEA